MTPENAAEVFAQRDANSADGTSTVLESLERAVPNGQHCLPPRDTDTALILAWPFIHCVARGRWKWLALQSFSRWPTGCSAMAVVRLWRRFELCDMEPNSVGDDGEEPERQQDDAHLFQPRMFQELADYLRENRPLIEQGALDPEAERSRIESYVGWLERCVAGCSTEVVEDTMYETRKSRGGRYFSRLGRHVQYFSEFFVKVICFTIDIRNDNTDLGDNYVGRVFKRAIRLMPAQVKTLLEEMYASQTFPSPSTISRRANLYLDVAFMRVMAGLHAKLIDAKALFFGLSDASPQGGRLYQITEYYCFGGTDVSIMIEGGRATCRLRSFSKHPEDITQGDLSVMESLMEVIRAAKSLHVFAPMCMESTNSGTEVRGHALIQQVRIENFSWEETAKMFTLFFTFTVDRGPESGFRKIYLENLDTMPHWRPLQMESTELPDLLGDEQESAAPKDPVISLAHIIDVAGVFHIIDLIEKRMLAQLASYVLWQKHFESAVNCYHRPYLRRRFVNRCLSREDDTTKARFSVAVPNLEGGRVWTVVSQLGEYFGAREEVIRSNWNQGLMGGDALEEEDDEVLKFKDTGVHVSRANESFEAPSFWAMIATIRIFSNWLAALMYWCQACPCHPRRFREYFTMRLDKLQCPLRGCRAPDIAAGELTEFNLRLSEDAQLKATAIQQRQDLTPAQRGSAMDEFNNGREYIMTEFNIRVRAGWESIPLRSLVVGHQDMDVVIGGLVQCLMQFEALTAAELEACSQATLVVFARGSVLREQILCLIQGHRQFEEMPALERYRFACQQVPIPEQSVERRHAQIHAATRASPNHTVQYDSVHGLRKGEIVKIFDETPEDVQNLASVFGSDARNPNQCLESLGLLAHPMTQSYVKDCGEGVLNNIPHNVASDVIYRADDASQSQRYPKFKSPPPPLPPTDPGDDGHDGDGVYVRYSFNLKQLMLNYRMLLGRTCATRYIRKPGARDPGARRTQNWLVQLGQFQINTVPVSTKTPSRRH